MFLRSLMVAPFAMLLAAGCASSVESPRDDVGRVDQDLYEQAGVKLWTANGNNVPMCWATPGYAREKKIITDAIANTWVAQAKIHVTWADTCPTAGSAQYVKAMIGVHTQATGQNGVLYWDHSTDGQTRPGQGGMDTLSGPSPFPPDVTKTTGMTVWVESGGTSLQPRMEYVAVHEFGHVLGFTHEQDRPKSESGVLDCRQRLCAQDKASNCSANPTASNCTNFDLAGCMARLATHEDGTELGVYDANSIMNYCNADGNNHGILSPLDIVDVKNVYGDTGLPSIFAVTPNSGPNEGTTRVQIDGVDFSTTGGTQVRFGRVPSTNVSCPTSTRCFAYPPPQYSESSQQVTVDVVVGGLTSQFRAGNTFTYAAGPACSSSFSCTGHPFGFPDVVIQCPSVTNFYTHIGGGGPSLAASGTTFTVDANNAAYAIDACDTATGSCSPFSNYEASATYCGAVPTPVPPSTCNGRRPTGKCSVGWRCCGGDGWSCGVCE